MKATGRVRPANRPNSTRGLNPDIHPGTLGDGCSLQFISLSHPWTLPSDSCPCNCLSCLQSRLGRHYDASAAFFSTGFCLPADDIIVGVRTLYDAGHISRMVCHPKWFSPSVWLMVTGSCIHRRGVVTARGFIQLLIILWQNAEENVPYNRKLMQGQCLSLFFCKEKSTGVTAFLKGVYQSSPFSPVFHCTPIQSKRQLAISTLLTEIGFSFLFFCFSVSSNPTSLLTMSIDI